MAKKKEQELFGEFEGEGRIASRLSLVPLKVVRTEGKLRALIRNCGFRASKINRKIRTKNFPLPEADETQGEFKLIQFQSRTKNKELSERQLIATVSSMGYQMAHIWELAWFFLYLPKKLRKQILSQFDIVALGSCLRGESGAKRVPFISSWRKRFSLSEGTHFDPSRNVFLIKKKAHPNLVVIPVADADADAASG